jgi:acetyl esterase/lipase
MSGTAPLMLSQVLTPARSRQPALHPEMKVLLDARKGFPPATTVAEQRRQWTVYTQALSRPAPPEVTVRDMSIPAAEVSVPVRIYRHVKASAKQPCIVYLHGGGFMLGDLDSSDSIAWGYCHESEATVVSVDYRLSPEHPWPAAFDDGFGVLSWLSGRGAQEIEIDPGRIALAGDSAGGRLSAGLSLKTRDVGGPRIVAQALIYASAGAVPGSRPGGDRAEDRGVEAVRVGQNGETGTGKRNGGTGNGERGTVIMPLMTPLRPLHKSSSRSLFPVPRSRCSTSVTGPSLWISTCIMAPNSPVSTRSPLPRSWVTNRSYNGIATSGRAASMNDGRRPL